MISRSKGYQLAVDGNTFTTYVRCCGVLNGHLSMGSGVSLIDLFSLTKIHNTKHDNTINRNACLKTANFAIRIDS